MAKVFIEESTLTDIGDAIRAKTGDTAKMSPASMVDAIAGITSGEVPEEAMALTGSMDYAFYKGGWNWFIDTYGDSVTTSDITSFEEVFFQNYDIESVPFDINFVDDSNVYYYATEAFCECTKLKEIGAFRNFRPGCMKQMFLVCQNLRYLPEMDNASFSYLHTNKFGGLDKVFFECNSLRSIPEDVLCQLYTSSEDSKAYGNELFTNTGFIACYALDELKGLYPPLGTRTGSIFTFMGLSRVKNITFATQEDGSPYTRSWSNQNIDLSDGIGYSSYGAGMIINYNSGITADKEVDGSSSYEALKDDPDWFSCSAEFSRYNHDSAVATLATLPDTSAYMETVDGNNYINFLGISGSGYGKAISSLTEEEVAVAVSRGWTVGIK